MFDRKWNILPLWFYTWENEGLATTYYYTPETMGLLTIDQNTGEIGEIPIKGDPVLAYSVIFAPDRKRAYAVMDKQRMAVAPDIPTVDEAGLPKFHISVWHALWLPKGTPKPILATTRPSA